MKLTHQQYFEGVHRSEEYISLINSAQKLAAEQEAVNRRNKAVNHRCADICLNDKVRYTKGKDFKSDYHKSLYYKYIDFYYKGKNLSECCPVMELLRYLELKDRIKKYSRKVYSRKIKSSTYVTIRKNLMPFNEAFDIYIDSYLKPKILSRGLNLLISDNMEEVISDLVAYFTRQENSKLKLNKGICLYGNIGTGKSTIMSELSKFTKDYKLDTSFDFVYMDDIYTECDSKGLSSLNNYKFKSYCFDDIGMRAENNVNNYGTKIDSYKELVRRQYNRYSRPNPNLSFYTTNIAYNDDRHISDLVKVFGSRELDRFKEMCNFVGLFGKSLREF